VVAPFRVAADASFDYLSEGLVDLLATSLNGETGSRAVDPRASIAAWRTAIRRGEDDVSRSSAQAIARRLGAGQLLMGSLVGTQVTTRTVERDWEKAPSSLYTQLHD
jgi:hypothetical protein